MRRSWIGAAFAAILATTSCVRTQHGVMDSRSHEIEDAQRLLHEAEPATTPAQDPAFEKALFFDRLNHASTLVVYERFALTYDGISQAVKDGVAELDEFTFAREPYGLESKGEHGVKRLIPEISDYVPIPADQRSRNFRPEHAVEWRHGHHVYHLYVCSACGEILLIAPGTRLRSKLRADAGKELLSYFENYRKDQPAASK